eukprot:939235-Pyramimonas_sp.AAC.1
MKFWRPRGQSRRKVSLPSRYVRMSMPARPDWRAMQGACFNLAIVLMAPQRWQAWAAQVSRLPAKDVAVPTLVAQIDVS